jgi:hypothetical protein
MLPPAPFVAANAIGWLQVVAFLLRSDAASLVRWTEGAARAGQPSVGERPRLLLQSPHRQKPNTNHHDATIYGAWLPVPAFAGSSRRLLNYRAAVLVYCLAAVGVPQLVRLGFRQGLQQVFEIGSNAAVHVAFACACPRF